MLQHITLHQEIVNILYEKELNESLKGTLASVLLAVFATIAPTKSIAASDISSAVEKSNAGFSLTSQEASKTAQLAKQYRDFYIQNYLNNQKLKSVSDIPDSDMQKINQQAAGAATSKVLGTLHIGRSGLGAAAERGTKTVQTEPATSNTAFTSGIKSYRQVSKGNDNF